MEENKIIQQIAKREGWKKNFELEDTFIWNKFFVVVVGTTTIAIIIKLLYILWK